MLFWGYWEPFLLHAACPCFDMPSSTLDGVANTVFLTLDGVSLLDIQVCDEYCTGL
jgi:hypothetical protein